MRHQYSDCLSPCLSIYLSVYLHCLSVSPSNCLPLLTFCLSLLLSVCLSFYLSERPSVVRLSVFISGCQCVCLCIPLSVRLFGYQQLLQLLEDREIYCHRTRSQDFLPLPPYITLSQSSLLSILRSILSSLSSNPQYIIKNIFSL